MEYSSPAIPTAQSTNALVETADVVQDVIQIESVISAAPSEIRADGVSPEPLPLADSSEPTDATVNHPAIQIFLSTFFTIFLAELGDKTQLTTLLMSAESHAPWTVFAGAGTALIATSLIGCWLGCWLAKRVAPETLEKAAGCLLLLISAQLFWEFFHW